MPEIIAGVAACGRTARVAPYVLAEPGSERHGDLDQNEA